MRTENDFGPFVHDTIDSRQSRADPSVVGDLKGFVEGNIKIGADNDALPTKLDVVNGLFSQVHGTLLHVSSPRSCTEARAALGAEAGQINVLLVFWP